MFKVKATVVGFDRDEKKYPCHFRYSVGEEIIYDGETVFGRICPAIFPKLAEIFKGLQSSGGRHQEGENPGSYYPFWHSPLSLYDPSFKKYDGIGFKPTLERPDEGYKYIPDETLFDIPPDGKYNLGKGTSKRTFELVCPDTHTLARFKIEAFDLSDKGDGLPYFRRTMSILHKVKLKSGIPMEQIINEFSEHDRDHIYPTLGQNMIAVFVGELELMGYVEVKEGNVAITDSGVRKLDQFKASLSAEEKEALHM
jgi:uncharacterized repeat protein (TIGR04076 family)